MPEWGTTFAFAIVGSIAVQLLHWLEISKKGRWPEYAKSRVFWVLTTAFVLVGGIIAVAYFNNRPTDPFLAVQMGASMPLLIEKLGAGLLPNPERHLGDEDVYGAVVGFFRP